MSAIERKDILVALAQVTDPTDVSQFSAFENCLVTKTAVGTYVLSYFEQQDGTRLVLASGIIGREAGSVVVNYVTAPDGTLPPATIPGFGDLPSLEIFVFDQTGVLTDALGFWVETKRISPMIATNW